MYILSNYIELAYFIVILLHQVIVFLKKRLPNVRVGRWTTWTMSDKYLNGTQKKDPQDVPIRTYRLTVKEPWRSHPPDESYRRSITVGRTNVKRINKPQYHIIGMSNKLTNPWDWITKTLKESRILIRTHKPLNTQKLYMYAQAD